MTCAGTPDIQIMALVPPTLRSGKRRTAVEGIANALSQVVSDGDVVKPNASSMNSRAEDDVTYLYTVDSSTNGCIVPEIDLSQESEIASLVPQTAVTKDVKPASSKGQKRKFAGNQSARKRSNKEIAFQCQKCKFSYCLTAESMHMLLASCGHLFCKHCPIEVGIERCSCGQKVHVLRKLYR